MMLNSYYYPPGGYPNGNWEQVYPYNDTMTFQNTLIYTLNDISYMFLCFPSISHVDEASKLTNEFCSFFLIFCLL